MKKLLGILLVVALLLPVLAGCQGSANSPAPQAGAGTNTPTPQETTAPTNQVPAPPAETTTPTEPADSYITREEAKEIALKDAGLTEAEVRDLEVELDRDDGPVHYDVDFEKGSADYDYDIDAKTGEILYVQKPQAAEPAATAASTDSTAKPASSGSSSSGSSSGSSSSKQLTKNEARDIALKHAGLKASEVRELEVELDRDDGTLHYDVDFEKDGYDYDYEIDAKSGKILKSRKERD